VLDAAYATKCNQTHTGTILHIQCIRRKLNSTSTYYLTLYITLCNIAEYYLQQHRYPASPFHQTSVCPSAVLYIPIKHYTLSIKQPPPPQWQHQPGLLARSLPCHWLRRLGQKQTIQNHNLAYHSTIHYFSVRLIHLLEE